MVAQAELAEGDLLAWSFDPSSEQGSELITRCKVSMCSNVSSRALFVVAVVLSCGDVVVVLWL